MSAEPNLYNLAGKVALVTGAARGLGATMAQTFVDAGATVIVTDVLADLGRQTVESLRAKGAKAHFIRQDVTSEADWERTLAESVDKAGRLDILVNNAGIERMVLTSNQTLEEFELIMKVNVSGVFLGCKHAIRVMSPGGKSGHGGSIINLSSIAGRVGIPAVAAYCASKGAVSLMTKSIAVECAALKTGIRVNSIHPGVVWTDMGKALPQQMVDVGVAPDAATAEKLFLAAHPIGRFGKPQDVASAALYLASDAASWMTGSEFVVDGGYTAM
jgi:3alpha(or 20beta)-hydroxysteroid dehydrogenase